MKESDQPQDSNFPPKLGQPAQRALIGAGYLRLEQLNGIREAEIKQLHGIGPNALQKLRVALQELGLAFAEE